MEQCWIIINGALHQNRGNELHLFLKKTALELNINATIIGNNHIIPLITETAPKIIKTLKHPKPDFILFLDKDIILAEHLELCGFTVFNPSAAIATCDNKIKSHLAFAKEKLPTPKTIFSPFIYSHTTPNWGHFICNIEKQFNYPFIIKEAYGSFGEQVYLIKNHLHLKQKLTELGSTPFLVQKLVSSSYGRDLRIYIVNDKCVCSVLRTAQNDFRANASQNSILTPYNASPSEIELAIAGTKATDANFAGVDLLFGEKEPLLCEVNSNPYITGTYRATAFNVAIPIFQYCSKSLQL